MIYKIVSYSNILIWSLAGLIVIGSNYFEYQIMNLIVGMFFLLIVFFSLIRYKTISQLKNEITKDPSVFNRFLILEILLFLIILLFGVMCLIGAGSRFFYERKSVFGCYDSVECTKEMIL